MRDVDFDALVDRIVESHRAVLATLEADVRAMGVGGDLAEPARRTFARFESEERLVRQREDAERERRERERMVRGLRPRDEAPRLDPPLITRAGIIYVPPVFEHASGIDDLIATRLVRAGYHSVGAFLRARNDELTAVTGLSVAVIERAKRDLDLTRLPQVDEPAADMLRLLGYSSVPRVALADPDLLGREVERLVSRHRLLRVPAVLSTADSRRRLIAAAEARAG